MGSGTAALQILRIGIVGCGKIADGHAEILSYLPGVALVAVCDREPILAEQLSERFRVPHWYSTLAEMLERERLDVVHITTPPGAHLPLTRQCVAAGAHVFLEKPLTLCAKESQELINAVIAGGRQMTINYWPNFDPPAMEFKKLLAEGVIGDPVHVEAFIGYDLAGAYGQALMGDAHHWVHALPGKLFQNMMDHIFNRIVPLLGTGEPEVKAFAYKRRPEVRGDGTDAMLDELRVYVRGGTVSGYGSLCSHARPVANLLRVYGTKNTLELDYSNRTVVLAASQKYPSSLGRLFPAFQMASRYLKQGGRNLGAFRRHEFQYFAGMSTLLEMFYQGIRTGGKPPIPYEEIMKVAYVMDQVIEQVYTNRGESR